MPVTLSTQWQRMLCASLLLMLSIPAMAQLRTLQTEHFLFHFEAPLLGQAQKAAKAAEGVYPSVTSRFDWQPHEKIQVHLVDNVDVSNGWAKPYPRLQMQLIVSPPDSLNSLAVYDNWYSLLIEHELTHIVQMDLAYGEVAAGRKIFGNLVWLYPNLFQPSWLLEGLAVHQETHKFDDKHSIGRGDSAFYRMMMREEVRAGIQSVQQLNVDYYHWPFGKQYLYGAYFYQFLAAQYGADSAVKLSQDYSDNLLPFLLNPTARSTFGKDFQTLWQEFDVWLQGEFAAELALAQSGEAKPEAIKIRKSIANLPAQGLSVLSSDGKFLYYLARDGYHGSRLMQINQAGQVVELMSLPGLGNLSAHPSAGLLYTTPTRYLDGRHLYDIYRIRSDAGKALSLQALTKESRYRQACYSLDGNSIFAYRQQAGESQLDRLDSEGRWLATVWQGQQGETISSLSCSPTAKELLVSLKKDAYPWQLYRAHYATKSHDTVEGQRAAQSGDPLQWQMLTTLDAQVMQPAYSSDGKTLLFVSEEEGRFNLYRLSLTDPSAQPQRLTDSASGDFTPQILGDQLYFQSYQADGFVLTRQPLSTLVLPVDSRLPQPYPTRPSNTAATSGAVPNMAVEDYSPWPSLAPSWWFPQWGFSEEDSRVGFSTSGEDGAQQHFYTLASTYELQHDNLNVLASYLYQQDFSIIARLDHRYVNGVNAAYIERNEALAFEWPALFSWSRDRWFVGVGAVSSQNSLDEIVRGAPVVSKDRTDLVGARLNFLRQDSYAYSLTSASRDGASLQWEQHTDPNYHGQRMQMQWQWNRPLGQFAGDSLYDHSVLGLQADYYLADAKALPWQLGGASNDPLSYGQQTQALRGYPAKVQTGIEGYRLTLDWQAPLDRSAHSFGMWPVGYSALDMTWFVEAGAMGASANTLSSVGMELHSQWNLAYRMPIVLQAGLAQGLDDGGQTQLYLLLRSNF